MTRNATTQAEGGEITQLLARWKTGDEQALERLLPLVYDELKGLARHHLRRERQGHSLQGTALIHEAFLRLFTSSSQGYENRAHFFGAAARAMRRVLVDHARKRRAGTRIPPEAKLPIDVAVEPAIDPGLDLLDLDQALDKLGELDPRLARVVELRCFVGMSIDETAALMNISAATVSREWKMARAFIAREIGGMES
ncbi:MAG: ECF-type sigma factor [Acidobacteriota bacterium]